MKDDLYIARYLAEYARILHTYGSYDWDTQCELDERITVIRWRMRSRFGRKRADQLLREADL